MSKARRHTLGLIFATATVALSYLVGSSVSPAYAATTDPVEDPAYWSQIWDHVGALNPSGFNPTQDWVTYESGWANDGYLASDSAAAAAKATIDAEQADLAAMEAAGSVPSEATLLGLGSAGLIGTAASGVGALALGYQIGTTTTRLLHIDFRGLVGGGAAPNVGPSFQTTGRIQWNWASNAYKGGSGFNAFVEVKDVSSGALTDVSSTTDCVTGSPACDAYSQSKYNLFVSTGWGSSTAQTAGCTSFCSETAAAPRSAVSIGVSSIAASGTPDRTYAGAGPQTDPGTASAKAGNVRAAIEANPTLHQQYDCKLDPAHYTCPQISPPPVTTPTIITSPLPWTPIYLPQPFPGETTETYAERLRSKQWLGAIVAVDDSMGYPAGSPATQLAPGTVTKLTVGTTTVNLYSPSTGQPVAWPLTPPQISTSTTPVTVTAVPATYTPSAGGGIHMPTISFACQFPFGFICWAQDVTAWFNVTPQAPNFDFTIPDQTVGGHTYHVGSHYDVNLNIMDSYMSTFRSILSVVLWVGGIYWLAVKLLGFHPGGDPGEAIDEGLDFDGL